MAHEAITLAVKLAQVLAEAWATTQVCKDLREECLALEPILKQNATLFADDPRAKRLTKVLKECLDYIDDSSKDKSKTKRVAFAVLEATVHKRLPEFKEQIQKWRNTTSFGMTVPSYPLGIFNDRHEELPRFSRWRMIWLH
jgi:hypothetical protein